MSPILFIFGAWTIYSYGFFAALGIGVAMLMVERRALREGIDPRIVLDLILLETFVLFAGARLWFVIQEWRVMVNQPARILDFSEGGFVFYGGLLAGIPAGVWFVKWKRQRVWLIADMLAPYIALGHAFGRIGCFL